MAGFDIVSSRVNFPELDALILEYWRERGVFRRWADCRPDAPLFTVGEPAKTNCSPGVQHVLDRVFRDVISRHRTMKGYRVIRKGGWDTHGLSVEMAVEQALGLSPKLDMEEYGIAEFNRRCRESVFRYVKDWMEIANRIGCWVDMEVSFDTLETDQIETGWWALKQLWDQGLLYRDLRAAPHCPRCVYGTSSHEGERSYREYARDPSVFVRFEATTWPEATPTYFLAWTTAPWTLPGNTALAVDAGAEYSVVATGDCLLILATALLDVLQEAYTIVKTVFGSELVGLPYRPLYDATEYGISVRRCVKRDETTQLVGSDTHAPRVVAADLVSMQEGTGIVPIAPAFGDEDLMLGREEELGFVQHVDLRGVITGDYPFAGKFIKDADPEIEADLEERGLLYHQGVYRRYHSCCSRCDTPLLYYTQASWYVHATAVKERLIEIGDGGNRYSGQLPDGRFGELLRNDVDWTISREGYWGIPIPIWRCDDCNSTQCVGSAAALAEVSNRDLSDIDLHRPFVDDVTWPCPTPNCGGAMRRVPEVMDCGFDSGATPFAEWRHPFENPDISPEGRSQAGDVCEVVEQAQDWFYVLHALSTVLCDGAACRNVLCSGPVLDDRGRMMSERLGNIADPNAILDSHGADALRWSLVTATDPGVPQRFSNLSVQRTQRQVLLTLWNIYSFFTNYANIDEFEPGQMPEGWRPEAVLDRWILAELQQLVQAVDDHLDNYNPVDAGRRIGEFIDVLSNWYVRHSRRRFWKSEDDADKIGAYATLYRCLTTVARLMAPLAPFVSENIYRNLELRYDPDGPDSVHLSDYPVVDPALIDREALDATRLAIRICRMGRAARRAIWFGPRWRQQLPEVVVRTRAEAEHEYLQLAHAQILEDLNALELRVAEDDEALYADALAAAGSDGDTVVTVGGYSVALEDGYMVAVNTRRVEEA